MRIVITGPESSGKTTLAKTLSNIFELPLVEEYARDYIKKLNRPYNNQDVEHIAYIQKKELDLFNGTPLIYDTDILTSIIWYQEKYDHLPSWMIESWKDNDHSYYLLCASDIPWETDAQRENPNDRERLFEIHERYLKTFLKDYKIIKGSPQERIDCATIILESLIEEK